MDTDEDENVSLHILCIPSQFGLTDHWQGVEGPIKFSGSTPELDDFTLRIVDGTL